MFIIIAGNVVDGLQFYGPFPNATDANDWADSQIKLVGSAYYCAALFAARKSK